MSSTDRVAGRWSLPPHLHRDPGALEDSGVLDEISGPAGSLLWQSVRDAVLWGLTPAAKRSLLFTRESEPRRLAAIESTTGIDPVSGPLRELASMLGRPAATTEVAVAAACDRISRWAEGQGAFATAFSFARAAALATPGAPRAALRAGRLARRRGDGVHAEGWLQRAVVLARAEGDGVVHAWAYSALGSLCMHRGNFPAAERYHLRALRIARRASLRGRAAAALHDLFVVCADVGRTAEAVAYARSAVATYGPKHENLPALAHDVALMWLERGEFARALPVLQRVLPHMAPHQRILGLASVARAAGALGARDAFATAAAEVLEIVDRDAAGDRENHPSALLGVGRGAASLGDLDTAAAIASRTRAVARELAQHRIVYSAEALLQAIAAEHSAARAPRTGSPAVAPRSPGPAAAPPDVASPTTDADALAGELLACFDG